MIRKIETDRERLKMKQTQVIKDLFNRQDSKRDFGTHTADLLPVFL